MIKLSVTAAGHATAGPIALWSPSRGKPPREARPPGSRGGRRARPPQQVLGARAEQAAPDLARGAWSVAAGAAPGQPDSRAEQPRVSPSRPEWPARSQSRMPPRSELPSWAGSVLPSVVTSGCLHCAASYRLRRGRLSGP